MHKRAYAGVVLSAWVVTACGSSPSAPTDDPGARTLLGQTVSAADGSAAAGIAVQVGRARAVTSDSGGMFEVALDGSGRYNVVLSSSGIVERRTTVDSPSSDRTRFSLIPSGFDLAAFDEMFRASHSRLQRWTTRPRLVVLASVMTYRSNYTDEFPATSEQLSDADVAAMIADLTEGLGLLTGGAYTSFASVEIERPADGARVLVTRPGAIVVGRYTGILTFAQTIGYGMWSEQSDGTVNGGAMFLDSDFDARDSRRRLLRIHELGHALGYRHVTVRTSIMNPSIGPEPTEFDRVAAVIAFQRVPGNRAPDTDPDAAPSGFVVTSGGSTWAAPIFCGHAEPGRRSR